MVSKQDFEIKSLSSSELVERLEGCSPLQACKVLLDVETARSARQPRSVTGH